MKNLKKVLSLALAFAMVLGLCVGAMAATPDVTTLKDWADVTQKDAAQLLNAFNIMAGDDKGNFNPANNVTRAEAAKMISVALWGGEDLASSFTGTGDGAPLFADVKNTDWFAGYVNYAATIGIVAGRNATTFDPKGNVTGYELLKMALTALGYDQNKEGLVGTNWKIKTMALAKGGNGFADITKGVTVTSWDAPLSRDNTAKVIANMIYRNAVTYDKDGVLISRTELNDEKETVAVSFGKYNLGLTSQTGTLVANAYGTATYYDADGKPVATTYPTVDPTKGNSLVQVGTTAPQTVTTNSTLLDLGTPVTLYSKGGKLISVVVNGWTEVAPTYNASYAITNYSKDATTGADNHKTIVHGDVDDYTCYSKTTYIDTNADGNIDVETTVYYNDVAEVKAVNETTKNGTVYQIGDNPWRDSYDVQGTALKTGFINGDNIGAKKGDRIAYVDVKNAVGGTSYQGVILTPVTGKVTRVSQNAYNQRVYHIDGDEGHTVATVKANHVGLDFGVSGTFYLDPDGNIGFYKGTATENKVALLYDAGYTTAAASTQIGGGKGTAVLTVAAILPDGTKGTYNVAKIAAKAYGEETAEIKADTEKGIRDIITNTNAPLINLNNLNLEDGESTNESQKNYLVEYYLDADGKMVITAIAGGVNGKTLSNASNGTINATVKAGDGIVGNTLITPSTITFVQTAKTGTDTKEDWAVYTGSTLNYTATNMSVVLAAYTSNTQYIKYAVADAGAVTLNTTSTTPTFYYVVANNGQIGLKGDVPVQQIVYFDATANEIKTVEMATNNPIAAGDIYTTIVSGVFGTKLERAIGNAVNNKAGYVTGFKDGIISLTEVTLTDTTNGTTDPTRLTVNSAGHAKTETFFNEITKAYVTTKDTKFYTINGDKSAAITASDVVLQGAVEPTVSQNKASTTVTVPTISVTVKYGAIVMTDGKGTATAVILFEKDPSFGAVYYRDTTPATSASSR